MTKAKPQSIGDRFREWREASGLRQDEVATAARVAGLDWNRDTVAAIENGRRELALSEVEILRGRPLSRDEVAPLFNVPADAPRLSVESAAKLDAEVKAARKLGVSPEAIVETAQRLWGVSLTEKRDKTARELLRLPEYTARYWKDQGVEVDEAPQRSVQAVRGHVTRNLLAELRDALHGRKKGGRADAQRPASSAGRSRVQLSRLLSLDAVTIEPGVEVADEIADTAAVPHIRGATPHTAPDT